MAAQIGTDVAASTAEDTFSRDVLVDRLRHQEQLVTSAECTWELRRVPTSSPNATRIRKYCLDTGRNPEALIYYDEDELTFSFFARWWRDGERERLEKFAWTRGGPGRLVEVQAFDGQIVRQLSGDGSRAAIETVETAHWLTTNRLHPFSFVYELANTPLSTIIEKGNDFSYDRFTTPDGAAWKVTVRHPRFDYKVYTLTFDQELRLRERKLFSQWGDNDPLVKITKLADYRSYLDRSGEQIDYPHAVSVHYYVGPIDGEMVENTSESIRVHSIKFNVDLPDELFVLSIPESADVIHDATQKVRLSQPAAAIPTSAENRTRVWIIIGINAGIVLAAAALAVWRWWRNRQTHIPGPE